MRSDFGKKHNKSDMQKLKELQAKAERRRLEGEKPPRKQIIKMADRPRKYEKMLSINPMQSAKVIREITRSMMPELINTGSIV